MKQKPQNTLGSFKGYQDGKVVVQLFDGGTILSQPTSNSGLTLNDSLWVARVNGEYSFSRWMPKS